MSLDNKNIAWNVPTLLQYYTVITLLHTFSTYKNFSRNLKKNQISREFSGNLKESNREMKITEKPQSTVMINSFFLPEVLGAHV